MMFSIPGSIASESDCRPDKFGNSLQQVMQDAFPRNGTGELDETIKFSLRGMVFEINSAIFKQFPETRLANLKDENPRVGCDKTKVYTFNRSPFFFQFILDFYESGELHLPKHLCHETVVQELSFWRISPKYLALCCYDEFEQAEELKAQREKMFHTWRPITERYKSKKTERDSEDERSLRDKAWLFLEDHHSSKPARIWSAFIGLTILLLITCLALSLEPDLREANMFIWESYKNVTENTAMWMLLHTSKHPVISSFELFGVVVMTLDIVTRFAICRCKKDFICDGTNIVQALATLPMWASVLFVLTIAEGNQYISTPLMAVYGGGVLGISRIFLAYRYAKINRSLKILTMSIGASWRELLLLTIAVNLGVLTFSLLAFYAELSAGTFSSMQDAFWWALITMTTVGYGDIYPSTSLGRFVASTCALCGVLLIALPVGIIGGNFVQTHNINATFERDRERKKRRAGLAVR